MTLNELINSARRAQYAGAKELLKRNPNMSKKEALRRVGNCNLFQERGSWDGYGHVERSWVSFEQFKCWGSSGSWYETAFKIYVTPEEY